MFRSGDTVTLPVFASRTFSCDLSDGYWLPAALRGGGYEPEVEAVLRFLLTPATTFVDCGANLGWWSLFASETIDDARRVLAVEAAPWTFAALTRNAIANDGCFTPVQAAVWDVPGEQVSMRTDPHRHAWASVDESLAAQLDAAGFAAEEVPTTTVDALVASAPGGDLVVVKLDVEGVELRALEGAGTTLSGNAVVIYEDHGRDASSRTTEAVIERFGLDVFHLEDGTLRLQRLFKRDLPVLKADTRRGYNLIACKSGTPVHDILSRHAESGAPLSA